MSERYPGGIINQTAPVPSGTYASSAASGVWTMDQQAYWKQQGLWPIPGNLAPNIEDVFSTWLYTGNGASQTIVNNIQLGNSNTGGSGSFFPRDSVAQLSTGSAMNFGSGNWTIEFYFQGNPYTFGVLFEIYINGGAGQRIAIQRSSSSADAIYVELGLIQITTTGATPWDGAWHHHAVVRNGGTITYYIDGVSRGTFSTSLTLAGTNTVRIANYSGGLAYGLAGYLSNLRVVSGTAVYTSSFTPPTSPLTAISGTQLLCMQGATPFVDNSTNAFTITPSNGAVANSLGPFVSATPGKGGLVWLKSRSDAYWNFLFDTNRGAGSALFSNDTGAAASTPQALTAFNSNGFSLGTQANTNQNASTFASWTFAEQPKFFDIVTYTGNGGTQAINHALGSTPGMVIIKRTDTASIVGWVTYHRSVSSPNDNYLLLNNTTTPLSAPAWISPTSTNFTLGNYSDVNASGGTFVAYLFAHNAGGFGTGSDNVISCGSFTTTAGGAIPTVTLGYEPQYLMFKCSSGAGNWNIIDNMRSFSQTQTLELFPNASTAETNYGIVAKPTATGFTSGEEVLAGSATFIYMAIRRPMAVPTVGTSVFMPVARTGTGSSNTVVTAGFPVDMFWNGIRDFDGEYPAYYDRLRGNNRILYSNATNAEFSTASVEVAFNPSNANTGITLGINNNQINGSGVGYVDHFFRRAPGFFDIVVAPMVGGQVPSTAHNLGVVPELMIMKDRNPTAAGWGVGVPAILGGSYLVLNTTAAAVNASFWSPTSTMTGDMFYTSGSAGQSVVVYLFATCAGVSKVGSYTGTGATQTIACGFTGGARYVLIKRTDSTGNWWVWDTARGMISGTDPRLTINSTTVEANNNWVLTTSTGFQIVTTDATVNASGGSYIFLAIA